MCEKVAYEDLASKKNPFQMALLNTSKSFAEALELKVNKNNCTAFCGETTDQILVNVYVKIKCLLKAVMILQKVFCCPPILHSTAQVASDVSFDWSVIRLFLSIYIELNEQREDFCEICSHLLLSVPVFET